jgi:hypothetical protein
MCAAFFEAVFIIENFDLKPRNYPFFKPGQPAHNDSIASNTKQT